MGHARPMSALKIEIDPIDAGFSAERLDRVDRHFQGYVDQKKLAGWHLAISRSGRLVHSSTSGHRDIAADLPFTDDTVVRMFSMTKPITSVAAMMLYEEGAFELKSPIVRVAAGVRRHPGLPVGLVHRPGHRTAGRADPGVAPADPHLGADLRVPQHTRDRRHLPQGRLRVGHPPVPTSPDAAGSGLRCPSRSSPAPSGTTACRPTCSVGWSRSCRACRSTSSSAPGSSNRSA